MTGRSLAATASHGRDSRPSNAATADPAPIIPTSSRPSEHGTAPTSAASAVTSQLNGSAQAEVTDRPNPVAPKPNSPDESNGGDHQQASKTPPREI
jgi:hypothetical protein